MPERREPRRSGAGPERKATRRVEFDADPDRIRANRELGRALRAIQSARVFLVTLAVVSGIVFLVLYFGWSHSNVHTTFANLTVGLSALIFAVFLTGSFRIRHEPLLWTLVGAVLQTLFAVLTLGILFFVLAISCWAAVVAVSPTRRLLREYPDLRIAARVRGERPSRRRR